MKIALISQYFYPETFSNNEIAKYLAAQGHKVDAICCVPNYPAGVFFNGYSNTEKRQETWNDVSIFRVRTFPRGDKNWHLLLNYLVFPFAAIWTFLTVAKTKYDVSLVSMPSPLVQAFSGVFLKYVRRVPLVYWVQDIWPESAIYTLGIKTPFLKYPLNWMCGWLYRRADLILVQSEAFPSMITRFGVPLDKIRVFPNTAPDTYRPLQKDAAPQAMQHLKNDQFRLMFAGNVGASQDFDTLIEAAKIVKQTHDVSWLVVGSGRDLERVQNRVKMEGLDETFHFLGRHPEHDMPLFFAQADALLVSLKDTPIFKLTVPYKVQCYMACGKPIVASLSGEGPRIINEANAGLSVPPSQPTKLAETIINIASMQPKERDTLGQNGRDFFTAHYSQKIILARMEKDLESVSL